MLKIAFVAPENRVSYWHDSDIWICTCKILLYKRTWKKSQPRRLCLKSNEPARPEEKCKVLGFCRPRWCTVDSSDELFSLIFLAPTFSPPSIPMSNQPIYDHGHDDHQESSAASLMGIDTVAPNDEMAVLLDVESDSTHYGSTTQLNNGGCSCSQSCIMCRSTIHS